MCGSGREGQRMLCLRVTRKELPVETFALGNTHTHTTVECGVVVQT